MMNHVTHRLRSGFSLIEVLIAVVILSVGLLALAALQINVVRSTADAKSRSTALSLAQEKLEQAREFVEKGNDPTACANPPPATWPEQYSCVQDSLTPESNIQVGGTNFTRSWTVDRYVFDQVAGAFDNVIPETASDAAITTYNSDNGTGYLAGTEFKAIEVTVSWVDAEGETREVRVKDSVSSASPSESAKARAPQRPGVRQPQVLIANPNNTAGVIPIAIGDDTETAATNPRPEVISQGNDSSIVETRFDVLTYHGDESGLALVQKRIETSVIGCTCDTANGGGYAYRPTVWSGVQYSDPEKASYQAIAGAAAGNGPNAVTQSSLCSACCRDHHDPTGVAAPKFDPYRSGSHDHFLVSDLSTPITNGRYNESCRLIRVNGIFRVAADLNSEHFGLVATADSARSPVPSTSASASYESFVLDYLGTRFVSGSAYNVIPGTADGMAALAGLDNPDEISINGGPDQQRYLHARGLYIDHLEQDALDKIANVKADCGSPITSSCVLPYVPFTTINVTELATWSSSDDDVIAVLNNTTQVFGNPDDPVRGVVSASGEDGNEADALTVSGLSNSQIARYSAIDNSDSASLSDAQHFVIGQAAQRGDSFTVNISGWTFVPGVFPGVGYTVDMGADQGECGNGPDPSTPNPILCSTNSDLNIPGGVVLSAYIKEDFETVTNPCQTNKTAQKPYCTVRNVDSATITSASSGTTTAAASIVPSPLSDVTTQETVVSFSNIGADDVVTVTFSSPIRVDATSHTCGGSGNKTPTWTSPCN